MSKQVSTNQQRDHYSWTYRLRVRYSEIDYQGIVFNAHYLTYFDVALTEFMREQNFDFVELVKRDQLDFHLVKSTVEYRQPIRADQLIEIGVRPGRLGQSSVTWHLAIFAEGQDDCLASGEIIWVCSKVGAHKSHPLPEQFRAKVQPLLDATPST
ncbi:MAG TPA: thioesterase family protein [Candidatus Kapabacteria bacterium]|nr:thioesterase family protein [Candidatus Kapabacteria bacterium]